MQPLNAERFEQAGLQIIQQRNAGDLLQNGREHVRRCAVIYKVGSRFMLDCLLEEILHPTIGLDGRLLGMSVPMISKSRIVMANRFGDGSSGVFSGKSR